jgi:hypothetical protein
MSLIARSPEFETLRAAHHCRGFSMAGLKICRGMADGFNLKTAMGRCVEREAVQRQQIRIAPQ